MELPGSKPGTPTQNPSKALPPHDVAQQVMLTGAAVTRTIRSRALGLYAKHSNLGNKTAEEKTNSPTPLSCGKGKHAEWPKCRLPQINILLLFVWEKCPRSPWELYLSEELEAHAVLRRRPNNCTLVEGAPTKAALSE